MPNRINIDWSYALDAMPYLLMGAKYTVIITVFGLLIGFFIGVLSGMGRLSQNKIVYGLVTGYIEIIRGTPILVQAIWIYFALPVIIGININSITAGIIAISINSGAYIAEIVRGSIQSIDRGQVEAGRSLGLTGMQTFVHIIWPQAFKRMIPPLGNQFIISLKDTSILTVIAVPELVRKSQEVVAENFRSFEIYTAAALLYLVMTLTISTILRTIERRLDVS
ncbi:MAG: amino acid ABC transporter permease [Bacillaceae bacterium]|nr:amino acid ABC transporter permease [Bacillaceae bacterium]